MRTITATEARKEIYHLIDEAASNGEPVQITGKRNNVVMVSEDDWRSIQETLYLLSVPGMREAIVEGMNTPIDECSENPGW